MGDPSPSQTARTVVGPFQNNDKGSLRFGLIISSYLSKRYYHHKMVSSVQI